MNPHRPKILLLDDEQELLELYRDLLSGLSSKPEIITCTTGARALALLDEQPFDLLISDLRMPRMDGLQVLSIVRRKFPDLRLVVMTGISDEHFRSRAYALGIDLFWQKPNTSQEIQLFLECIESLLGRQQQSGFRGVQRKSLVDLIQLECLSQGSSVLKITNGPLEGRLWVLNGDIIDAAWNELTGEKAFQQILSWKTGNFEILPAEPEHPRTIHASVHGLLLETAQTLDEAGAAQAQSAPAPGEAAAPEAAPGSLLATLRRSRGVEFLVEASLDDPKKFQNSGMDNPEAVSKWSASVLNGFQKLGETLHAGDLLRIEGTGHQQHVGLGVRESKGLCIGLSRQLGSDEFRETIKTVLAQWAS